MKMHYTGKEFYQALLDGEEILGVQFTCTHRGSYTYYNNEDQKEKRTYKDRWFADVISADGDSHFANLDVYIPDDEYMINGPGAYPSRHPESLFMRSTVTIRSYKHGIDLMPQGKLGFSCFHVVLWRIESISRDDEMNTLNLESSMTQVIDKEPVEVDVLVRLSLVDGRITIDRLASTDKELHVH